MSAPLIAAALWVLAASLVALLPMRRQIVPGLALLVAAPVVVIWIGRTHGWLALALALAAVVSMFRKPLSYMIRRALGRAVPPGERP